MTEVESVLHAQAELGEGPVWHGGFLYWVDIVRGHLNRFDPSAGLCETTHLGCMVGAVAPRRAGGFIAATENGFALAQWGVGIVRSLGHPEALRPENRFNDGKCDPRGRFWAGTMERNPSSPAGTMYLLGTDGAIQPRFSGIRISNGLCWSLDGRTFYHNDTPTQQIAAYDFDPDTGNLGPRRPVVSIPEAEGCPDGMTIDVEGHLWVALWGGWAVACYDPETGRCLRRIAVPVAQPSSCVFGGDDFADLYITSARQDLSPEDLARQPLAGNLFRCRPGVTGMPADEYGG